MAWNQIPTKPGFRHDGGYINLLNQYGTMQDNSTAYQFQSDGIIPDIFLTEQYEGNDIFAKIIDSPAEESIKHGYELGLTDTPVETYINDMLDNLAWDEAAADGVRWSRLYGGALGLLLVDDGRGIDESLDWKNIRSIEEIRIYDRSVVWPDYTIMHNFNPSAPWQGTTTQFGMPEYYFINSIFGQFWVHESRCLIFRNGKLPERTMQPYYRFWGIPEYIRIKRAVREFITSHSTAVKMLERSVQPIFSMQGLSELLQTDEGRNIVVERLKAIDKGRHLLNSIVIDTGDSSGKHEDYDFKTFPMSGVKDVVETTCNMLSAVTNIPQTVLFGRSPTGMNATGHSDFENYYNYIERIQKLMLKKNMQKLVDIIVCAGLAQGKLEENPGIKLAFNPLWSMSDKEQAEVNHKNAQTQHTKAQTAKMYFEMGVLDPSEIRQGLAEEGDFSIEDLLESIGADPSKMPDLWGGEDLPGDLPPEGSDPLPPGGDVSQSDAEATGGVGVLVIKNGKVLIGIRSDDGSIGGPGGHIEDGETPAQAAIRETQEEFGITPLSLKSLGQIKGLDEQHGNPHLYLCTDYEGTPKCTDGEIKSSAWMKLKQIPALLDMKDIPVFPPFAKSLEFLKNLHISGASAKLGTSNTDSDEQKWITINGTPVPVSDDGNLQGEVGDRIMESGESGQNTTEGVEVGTLDNPSAFVANPDLPDFTPENLERHFGSGGKSDHSKDYPHFSKEQYAARALELARSPVGEGIEGYKATSGNFKGSIVRYDTSTNDWVRAWPTGVASMFKPNDKAAYFERITNIETRRS